MQVHVARRDELKRCRDIERAAGALFLDTPFAHVAAHDPMSLDDLEAARRQGTLWTARFGGGDPAGFLLAEEIPEGLYIHEISVHPDQQRRGLARGLIEHAASAAADGGSDALWLRTFREIPWNRPLYERLGFHIVTQDRPRSIAADLIAHEATLGLSEQVRCTMMRTL